MEFSHYSVMLHETIEQLKIKPDGIYVDGTCGGAGHGSAIAEKLIEGRYIGIDQDEDAVKVATERLKKFGDRAMVVKSNYVNAKTVLEELGISKVDGILLDLGVSSYQFDNGERGFSYRFDAPLDMRMDQSQSLSVKEIVNTYPEKELIRIIRDYGEEKFAANIVKHISKRRAEKPIETTFELNEIIKAAIPAKMRVNKHPSKQTFQALRIECNDELGVLKRALEDFIDMLNPGGRLAIITFHSLEDRIVKNFYKEMENPCICPKEFPVCVCGRVSKGKTVTRKPITPSEGEMEENPRSKSAKLRVFEKGVMREDCNEEQN